MMYSTYTDIYLKLLMNDVYIELFVTGFLYSLHIHPFMRKLLPEERIPFKSLRTHVHTNTHMHTFTYCSNFHKHGLLVSSESGVVLQLPHSWHLVFHYCWISDWDSVCCFKMIYTWINSVSYMAETFFFKFLTNYKSYVIV